ncbi:hypothetical protein QE380_002712 [Acinetobacter baylyi]|uniref:Phage protein n=1 Tax=Acinetobacter baylyi TaxID=202950 RepID=A0ABU0UZ35_ACIBI|nr:hypothetical protein [Acinetobacter baylyi]MDQ1209789.1 hypothetical protein [Acinetobacter baylyi]MDR6106613.1 hypothetical protein [Acinetobacter baylyi]MDR6186658.1 hypothetical protein [Acinetobacter baylyi]
MAIYIPEWLEISKQRAVENGYEPFEDPEAYGGEVFVKDDCKWIHSIGRLKHKLGVVTDDELEALGYSVVDYNRFNSDEKELSRKILMESISANEEILEIFGDPSDYSGGLMYLSDGMYMDDEGNVIDGKDI